MHVVPCLAPTGPLDAAPITSLALHMEQPGRQIAAFWGSDDRYLVRAEDASGVSWYRIEAEAGAEDEAVSDAERARLGALLSSIIPIGGHTVTFPVGSTGRRVYRVWSGGKNAAGVRRTRILGVRAARSRRLPA